MTTNKWIIDPSHSEIQFKVKHLMISTVTGHFKNFNLEVTTEGDDFKLSKDVVFTLETDSIDTNNEQRDTHLKSADFFNSAMHKQIKFESKGKMDLEAGGVLNGNLTIGDFTKPINLKVASGGIAVDGYGQTKAGFTIEAEINRKDFGLKWGAVTEAGGVIVSDMVKITADIQLIKQV
jgi:polyisoprenoid-binding protein YceI